MRGLAVVGLLVALTCPAGAWPADMIPGDRLRPALISLDYERPWPGLAIRRGAASAGLALPGGIRVGARASDLAAPTIHETTWGGWVLLGQSLFAAADRVSVGASGLEASRRLDVELALQLGADPLAVGWSARVAGVDRDVSPVWRQWWLAFRRHGIELSLGRRVTPWQMDPAWHLGIRFAVAERVESAFGWRGGESTVALRFQLPSSRVTAATPWSGARAGAFAFRFEAGAP